MEKVFKCKDEVIYRRKISFGNGTLYTWDYGVVTYEDKDIIHLVGSLLVSCREYDILSYEGNEHLVGTTDEPDEEVRLEEGEYLICFDNLNYFKAEDFCLSPFASIVESDVKTKDGCRWRLFIKFSDFNPNDMEATKAKILCVKNGKVVKFRN